MTDVNGATVIVAVAGAVSAVAAAWLSARAARRSSDNEKAAVVIEQWSKIAAELRQEKDQLRGELDDSRRAHAAELDRRNDELQRHIAELGRAANELASCEKRCKECHEKVGELLGNLAALGALVTDEITKSAVATVVESDVDAVDDKVELDAIRAFIAEARRQHERGDG